MASGHSSRKVTGSGSHSKHVGTSEYVHIGSPEETLLETYFVMLSKFNFDRAREQCDREREGKGGLSGTNWCDFMAVLSRLANCETNYFSLSFMDRSSSLVRLVRKESLKVTYEALIQDFKKVHEVYYHGRGGTHFSWEKKMTELGTHIIEFVAAKRDMTDFYMHFEDSDTCHLDYKRLEKYLKDIHERYKDSFQHHFLKPVKTTFMKEVGVLTDLIHAQVTMSEWQFLPSIFALNSADHRLTSWHGVLPIGRQGEMERPPPQKSIRSAPLSPPPQGTIPYLYHWICKFHVGLLAKFTLYFHQVLTEHASVYDMRHLSAKLDVDYVLSMSAMIRQSSALCVSLVFNSNGLPDFKGPKYYFPDAPEPSLTGLNSYPFMISVPHDFEFYHHRANIVSLIMEKEHVLNTSAQLVGRHDEKLQCTYLMAQADIRVTVVVILSSRKRERDAKVTAMLSELATQLRNSYIANMLRPNS